MKVWSCTPKPEAKDAENENQLKACGVQHSGPLTNGWFVYRADDKCTGKWHQIDPFVFPEGQANGVQSERCVVSLTYV